MLQFEQNRPLDVIMFGRIALDINPEDFGKSFIENKNFNK